MLFNLLPIAEIESSNAPNPILVHVVVSAVLFLLIWQILSRIFFKPVFKVLEEREARTYGDDHGAQRIKDQAQDLTHKIEAQIRIARADGIKKRDEVIAKSEREANKILENGQRKAAARLKEAQLEIHQLKDRAKKELAIETDKLANEVVSRVLN